MRKSKATRFAGAVTLVALGALTTFALRPSQKAVPIAPQVQTRTEVIHRTVWIVKHDKPITPHRVRTPVAGAPPSPGTGGRTLVANAAGSTANTASSAPRTATSRARAAAPTTVQGSAAPASLAGSTSSGSTSNGSVKTHTSRTTAATAPANTGVGQPASTPATRPVTTGTSGSRATGTSRHLGRLGDGVCRRAGQDEVKRRRRRRQP